MRKNSFLVNSIISYFPVKWEVFLLIFFSVRAAGVIRKYFTCTVAIRNLSFMQFIAIKLRLWISNLRINGQNAAASADAKVR